ncbi:MAG: hypothetical protein EBR82_35410 [Caulobacteraceae bacterium]|nr:hypothetical protein [Caulobacteraceae bacterium]
MAVEGDTDEDPTIELPAIRRQPPRAAKAEPAPAGDLASVLAAALASALGDAGKPKQPDVRYGEEDQSAVALIANRPFQIAAEDLPWKEIAGTAHGMDGMGKHVDVNERFSVRAHKVDYLIESGLARLDRGRA